VDVNLKDPKGQPGANILREAMSFHEVLDALCN
jgi:hypothetical protein